MGHLLHTIVQVQVMQWMQCTCRLAWNNTPRRSGPACALWFVSVLSWPQIITLNMLAHTLLSRVTTAAAAAGGQHPFQLATSPNKPLPCAVGKHLTACVPLSSLKVRHKESVDGCRRFWQHRKSMLRDAAPVHCLPSVNRFILCTTQSVTTPVYVVFLNKCMCCSSIHLQKCRWHGA